jgi:hypothetical protein
MKTPKKSTGKLTKKREKILSAAFKIPSLLLIGWAPVINAAPPSHWREIEGAPAEDAAMACAPNAPGSGAKAANAKRVTNATA